MRPDPRVEDRDDRPGHPSRSPPRRRQLSTPYGEPFAAPSWPHSWLAYVSFGTVLIVAIGSASASTTPGDAFSRASARVRVRAEWVLEPVDGRRASGPERSDEGRPHARGPREAGQALPVPEGRDAAGAGCRGGRGPPAQRITTWVGLLNRGGSGPVRGVSGGGRGGDGVPRWRGRRGRRGRRPSRAGRGRRCTGRRVRHTGQTAGPPPASRPGARGPGGPVVRRATRRSAAGPPRSPGGERRPGRRRHRRSMWTWAGVAAPEQPTSTHGLASTAARATDVGARPGLAGGGLDRCALSSEQPAVRQRLLHDDAPPRVVRLSERGASRRLKEVVQVAWTQANGLTPSTRTSSAARTTSRLPRPADAQPDDEPVLGAQPRELARGRPRPRGSPLSSVAEWTWYSRSHGAEELARLRQLRLQHRDRVVLDLVDRRVHPPLARRTGSPTSSRR